MTSRSPAQRHCLNPSGCTTGPCRPRERHQAERHPTRTRHLLLLRTGEPDESNALDTAVAAVLVEQGWRNQTTGQPITDRQTGRLLGALHRRLNLLGLTTEGWFHSPLRLTDTGQLAARSALRSRALRPRTTLL